ncbi:hypothetical protein NEMBOFW57_002660 [Staphylotrichum longicolle]|uniref:Uncharacterized protein n=1 Tax=Staphylotrichum longicolle TaxID=669026 RepID=A0AAD4F4P7_9PEZI|nr:hypothetical protein NEMBOFW57_002660 [Staphylotrichum longicolle]
MCHKEFIAYQCGHRSIGVVRPCPLTTAGHNFPVCGIPPDKPHYAETMCAACERQLHSRWVLIREWEHRWLHERGVCGCEVDFPGLLTTPRVIGDASTVVTPPYTPHKAPHRAAEDDRSPTPKATAVTEGSNDGQLVASQSSAEQTVASTSDDDRVPALFTETVTKTGEHHVTLRLSSLYAAEWQADHRAQHDAGKCNCPASFAPFQPQIDNADLAPRDRETLRRWREWEDNAEKIKRDTRDIDGQVDETMQRIVSIEKAFGKFDLTKDEPPKVNLPQRPTSTRPAAEFRGQTTNTRQHHSNNNRRFGGDARRARPFPVPAPPPFHLPAPFPFPFPGSGYAGGYDYRQHPPYLPITFTPAHPAYATAATFSDTIPAGVYPWTPVVIVRGTSGNGGGGNGVPTGTGGPYHTRGFVYHDSSNIGGGNGHGGHGAHGSYGQQAQGHGHGHGQATQVPADRQLLPPASQQQDHGKEQNITQGREDGHHGGAAGGGGGAGKGKQREQDGMGMGGGQEPLPLCGLPIGAGPEGTSHMPHWRNCPLRRSGSALAITSGGADGGEVEGVGGGEGEEVEREEQVQEDKMEEQGRMVPSAPRSEAGAEMAGAGEDAGQEDEREEEGSIMMPPSPLRRRHSAAT